MRQWHTWPAKAEGELLAGQAGMDGPEQVTVCFRSIKEIKAGVRDKQPGDL